LVGLHRPGRLCRPDGIQRSGLGLLKDTNFVEQLKGTLKALEFGYGIPVDIEFTVQLGEGYPRPSVTLHLLQCRPQSGYEIADEVHMPEGVADTDIVFGTQGMVPTGRARDIRYIVYVDLEKYRTLETSEKLQIGRVISRLNQRLEGQNFVLMGPGRWGSSNPDLGVKIGYADIYNTCALVEVGLPQGNMRPTLSYGTHFFQDLVESHIYPLAIYPGEPGNPFRRSFFEEALNALPALLPDVARYQNVIKVIDVPALTGGRVLELAMSGEESRALAYLKRP
jgi:pyruvate,water dikinase